MTKTFRTWFLAAVGLLAILIPACTAVEAMPALLPTHTPTTVPTATTPPIPTPTPLPEPTTPVAESALTDIVWEWVRFEGGDDSVIDVDDPSHYTLILNPDGTYQVRADCNQATGGYTLDDAHLTLKPGPTTLAECATGSLYNTFLSHLGHARTYVMDGDNLVLNLWADAGNMIFRPAQAAHLPAA